MADRRRYIIWALVYDGYTKETLEGVIILNLTNDGDLIINDNGVVKLINPLK